MEFNDIESNIRQKYEDAKILKENGSYANSIYLNGYCVELALKYAIAKHMDWDNCDVNNFKFLKTHRFDDLVPLTGKMKSITLLGQWHTAKKWSESDRYNPPSMQTSDNAEKMIDAVKKLVEELCGISL